MQFFNLIILLTVWGTTTVTSATKTLGTVSPCPKCPKSIRPSAVVVTKQYQPVPTCVPVKSCKNKKCVSTASCSTYDWVSTVIPCLGGATSTTITKTDQDVKLSHVSTVLTSHLPCATPTQVPHLNSTVPRYKNETCTSTKLETMVVDISAVYKECGPLAAMGNWHGSGLCKSCTPNVNETKQVVHVSKCLDQKCTTYKETWISRKATSKPTASGASFTKPVVVKTSTYVPTNGAYTISIPTTITPSRPGFTDPVTTTAYHTTTVTDGPKTIDCRVTITVTFTKTVSTPVETGIVGGPAPPVVTAPQDTPANTSPASPSPPSNTPIQPEGPGETSPGTPSEPTGPANPPNNTPVQPEGPGETSPGTPSEPTGPAVPSNTVPNQTGGSGQTSGSPSEPTGPANPSNTTPVQTGGPGQTSGTPSEPTGPVTPSITPVPTPGKDEWEYYGCLGSTDNFSSFTLESEDSRMTIDKCLTECQAGGNLLAGLYSSGCYCAKSVDEKTTSTEKANGICNIPCPGGGPGTCGGNQLRAAKLRLRTINQENILLDVYINQATPTTPTSSDPSETSSAAPDPSSDPEPENQPRALDADIELENARATFRGAKLRRGGMLRNPKAQQGPAVAKRDFGLKKPFGQ